MADEHAENQATMDMSEHLRTWRLFLQFFKWQIIGVVMLLVFLLAFRTG